MSETNSPDPADWAARLDRARPVVVTGAAGFIGSYVAERLLAKGFEVIGIDSFDPYYQTQLKEDRATRIAHPRLTMERLDIAETDALNAVFREAHPALVINLAAQAGVRYSIQNPQAYGRSNLAGFLNVLEACRNEGVEHLVYASTSSVYGGNSTLPWTLNHSVDHPVSLYAATKKANELMAHSYSHLFGLPATGLRFFTVYGPWGRPDMAIWKFTRAILAGEPIEVYNHGDMSRDFTYVDDIVEGVLRISGHPPVANPDFDRTAPDPATSWAPHRVFNIGNDRPEALMDLIGHLERLTGRKAEMRLMEMQPGDVHRTWADVEDLASLTGFRPNTPLSEGLSRFVGWYRQYHGV